MNRTIRTLSVVALAFILASCSNAERDFEKARRANTEEAYKKFIEKHPSSPLVVEAKTRIENNAFAQAKRAGTSAAYDAFLKRFPISTLAKEANTNLQAVAYQEAKRAATIAAYEAFLRRFPAAEDAANATAELEKIEFNAAANAPSIANWQAFLGKYPQSANGLRARHALAHLILPLVVATNTVVAFEDFAKRFPDTEEAKEARKHIAKFDYQYATNVDNITTYERFLSKHSTSEFAEDVRTRLIMQKEESDWNRTLLANVSANYFEFWKAHPNTSRLKILSGDILIPGNLTFFDNKPCAKVSVKGDKDSSVILDLVEAQKWGLIDESPASGNGVWIGGAGKTLTATTLLLLPEKATISEKSRRFRVVARERASEAGR